MEAGHIKFILMDGIGKSFIDKTVTDEELLQASREILICQLFPPYLHVCTGLEAVLLSFC